MKIDCFKKGDVIVRYNGRVAHPGSITKHRIIPRTIDGSFTREKFVFYSYDGGKIELCREDGAVILLGKEWDDGEWVLYDKNLRSECTRCCVPCDFRVHYRD